MDSDIQFTENDHNVHIKQLDLNFIVVIRLSREVLSAMKLSEIKIKSPTKKQQISTKREAQIQCPTFNGRETISLFQENWVDN